MVTELPDLKTYCNRVAREARAASFLLGQATGHQKNSWLKKSAAALRLRTAEILAANALDIAAAPGFGLTDAALDRLTLSPARIDAIAAGLEEVAALPDPVGETIESSIRPNRLATS